VQVPMGFIIYYGNKLFMTGCWS